MKMREDRRIRRFQLSRPRPHRPNWLVLICLGQSYRWKSYRKTVDGPDWLLRAFENQQTPSQSGSRGGFRTTHGLEKV